MGSKLSRRRIVLSALLGITIILVAYSTTLPAVHHAGASDTDELLKTLASRDSDGDGLLDWEEVLYKTDPQNPNSVQEDLLDSEAVAQGIVSLTGPELQETSGENEGTASDVAPGSLTAQFTETFFASLGDSLQNGSFSEQGKETAVANLVEVINSNSTQLLESRYVLSSLSIQPGTSIDAYMVATEHILFRPDEQGEENLMSLITAAIEQESLEAKKRLRNLVAFYATIAKDLSEVSTPPNVADAHLQLVQSLDIASIAIASIANIDADPLIALASLSAFDSGPKMTIAALQEIMNVFIRVRGTPNDRNLPGYRIQQALNGSSPI